MKLKLENEEQQNLTDLQRKNEREMYELKQQIERAKVDMEQDVLKAQTSKETKKIKAEENASVLITKAEGQQRIIVNEVKADTVNSINKAKTNAQTMLISTDKQVAVMDINASTEYEQTQAYYSALVQECKAEESNLDAINAEREHTFQLKKADAYQSLGSGHKTKIVMSGANGENLIRKIFEL